MSDGTSYANLKEAQELLTGSWSKDSWTIRWSPAHDFSQLSVSIHGPDADDGEIFVVTDVMKMPVWIVERVFKLRTAFEDWKSGSDYVFRLPWSLRPERVTEAEPVPAPEAQPLTAEDHPF